MSNLKRNRVQKPLFKKSNNWTGIDFLSIHEATRVTAIKANHAAGISALV